MKICILTGKFGMGHMTVAKAVKEYIESSILEAETEIIDWFDYVSPGFSKGYYHLFELFVRKGFKLYNLRYRMLEDRKTDQRPEFYSYFKRCFKEFIEEEKPDVLISTLPICSQIASLYKEKTGSSIPLITCVTDITGHSEWINVNTNIYLVGSNLVKEKFIRKGVPAEKIFETGIPVRPGFRKNEEQVELKCQSKGKKVLIMGGGLGMLPVEMGFYNSLNDLPEAEITVITGKNQHLYELLTGKFENIRVLGYVSNVENYMKEADLIITKPGGATIFEAIFSEAPIFVINPFLQQEIYNASYIQLMGIGKVINNEKDCLKDLEEVLRNGELELFRNNIIRVKKRLNENIVSLNEILNYSIINKRKAMSAIKLEYEIKEKFEVDEEISFNI